MNGGGAFLKLGLDLRLGLHALLGVRLRPGVDLVVKRGEVWQCEAVGVGGRHVRAAFFGEVGLVGLLLHGEEELFLLGVEFLLGLVGEEEALDALDELLVARVLEGAEEALGAGLAELDAVEEQAGLILHVGGVPGWIGAILGPSLGEELQRLAKEALAQLRLGVHELGHGFAVFAELVLDGDDGRAGDDERRAGLVDQDGVHLVHDGEEMAALDLLLLAGGHAVVPEVVETELGVGAVGDVAGVHLAADVGRLVVEDAADGQPEEAIQVAHPLRVTGGEVVVDGDDMDAAPGEGVEIHGQRGHEGLALARRHLGDLALVQGHAADQLDVEGNHVPGQLMAAH